MTIHHVARKSNVVADAFLYHLDFAAIAESVKSSLLTWTHKAQAAACGNSWVQFMKAGSSFERGFLFCDGLLCQTRVKIEVSLIIPEDAGLQTDLLQ